VVVVVHSARQLQRVTLRPSLEEVVELRQALRLRLAQMPRHDFSKRAREAAVASTVLASLVVLAVTVAGPALAVVAAVLLTTDLTLVQAATAETVSP
jgi:hypothetical protein